MEGVVSGVASYGNCFGVPNVGGEVKFESCYSGNPLVNAFALGLVRRDQIFYAKAAGVGNPVIYVGSKTGRDGIHGATMASEEFSEESEAKRPNVQVGDPFMEKLLLEACLEAMQTGAVVGIQDMGAAGLTCSTCEMGGRGGVGLEIELDLVPQRETGMTPYEIMLSESQERMLLVAEKGREDEVFRVFQKWGLDAVTIGRVIDQSTMRVLEHGKVVAEIPNAALTDDAPLYHRPLERWEPPVPREVPEGIILGQKNDFTDEFKRLLASPNICSKRWVYEQYDSMVQTNTVEGPGGEGGVIRIKGTDRGLAMALDGNGRWCYLDPKLGAMHAVAESARNVACTGATPDRCHQLPELRQSREAAHHVAVLAGHRRHHQGLRGAGDADHRRQRQLLQRDPRRRHLSHAGHGCSRHYRGRAQGRRPALQRSRPNAGSAARLRGRAIKSDVEAEFGSSEYAKEILGQIWGFPPALELEHEAALQKAIVQMIGVGLVESAKDCSEGGLAVTLAESGFARGSERRSTLVPTELIPEFVLFGEDASRIVISCDPQNVRANQRSSGKIRRLSGTHRGNGSRQTGDSSGG